MAGDPRWQLRQALYQRLNSDPTLTALVGGRVYDDVVESPTYPFVVIDTINLDGSQDDKTNNFGMVTATIYGWSNYQGFKEVEQIISAVYDILHKADWSGSPTPVPGYNILYSRLANSEEGRDPDGVTRFSYIQINFLTDAD